MEKAGRSGGEGFGEAKMKRSCYSPILNREKFETLQQELQLQFEVNKNLVAENTRLCKEIKHLREKMREFDSCLLVDHDELYEKEIESRNRKSLKQKEKLSCLISMKFD
jgi:predicted RNase H-like nuclease (RuvC/YqgF family)